GEIPFYKIGTFGKKADSFINKATFEEYKNKYSYPKIGNILLSASGTLGRTVVYKGEEAYFQDSNIVWLDHDNKITTDKYLLHFFQNTKWKTVEGSTIKRLYNKDILAKKINLSNIEEQQKIGDLFEKLDQAISLQQQVLETTKEYKQSMLQKMFPKNDEKVPEIRFNGFKDLWSRKSLEQIADNYDRFRIPITSKDRIPGDTPYYGSNGIQDFVEGYTHEGNFVLLAEDGANDIDNYPVRFVSGKIWVNNHAHVLKAKDKFDLYFLSNVLKTINMRRYLVGSSRMKLNASTMMTIKMLVPTFKEQQKIGSFFKTLDEKIEQEEKKLETYQSIKKALMQRMFV